MCGHICLSSSAYMCLCVCLSAVCLSIRLCGVSLCPSACVCLPMFVCMLVSLFDLGMFVCVFIYLPVSLSFKTAIYLSLLSLSRSSILSVQSLIRPILFTPLFLSLSSSSLALSLRTLILTSAPCKLISKVTNGIHQRQPQEYCARFPAIAVKCWRSS